LIGPRIYIQQIIYRAAGGLVFERLV